MQWDTQHKPKPSNPCNKNRIWKCLRTYVSQGTIYLGGRERMQKNRKMLVKKSTDLGTPEQSYLGRYVYLTTPPLCWMLNWITYDKINKD